MARTIMLNSGEYVIAVVPKYASGPGWSNEPVWVYIAKGDKFRRECIQPDERTAELSTLYRIGAATHESLVNSIPVSREEN